jgi:hypothetical protein
MFCSGLMLIDGIVTLPLLWNVTVPVAGKSQFPPSNTETNPPGATGFG